MKLPERLRRLEGLAENLLTEVRTIVRECGNASVAGDMDDDPPATARHFYGWCRDNDMLKEAARYGKSRGLPRRIVDWSDKDAVACYRSLAAQHA
jgi:hypothetical protein